MTRARGDYENALYKHSQLSGERIIYMTFLGQNMTKYTANAMLATKISFMNDIAKSVWIKSRADAKHWWEKGIRVLDPRIGNKYYSRGLGTEDHAFKRFVKSDYQKLRSKYGYERSKYCRPVEGSKLMSKICAFSKVKHTLEKTLQEWPCCDLGLSFKPKYRWYARSFLLVIWWT